MPRRAAGWALALALALLLPGALPRPGGAALAPLGDAGPGAPGVRVAEGRVVRLDSRVSPEGYPVTDVTLEPGGERFTVLGGYKDGLRWTVDEEANFALGERVRVRLESAPSGLRVAGGRLGVETLDGPGVAPFAGPQSAVPGAPASGGGLIPTVREVIPPSGPAVADDSVRVEVRGAGFGGAQDSSGVFFQGAFEHVPASVLAWSDTLIRCLVPKPGQRGLPQVLSGSVKVWTPGGGWSDGDPWSGGAEYHVLFQYAGDSWSEVRLPMGFYVNPGGFPWPADLVGDLVATSAEVWHSAPFAYGHFVFRGFTDKRAMRDRDSTNVVGWTAPWPHDPNWLAVTWSGIDSITGERQEVDVEINGDKPWSVADQPSSDYFDLPTTLTHEFGHWFRLGHVQEPQHVMLAYQDKGNVRRVLQEGDRQGAAWVYPTFGAAHASTDTVHLGEPDPDALVLSVEIADRRGRPLAALAPGDVYAVAEWLDAEQDPILPKPESPPGSTVLLPDSPTDGAGRTHIVVPRPTQRGHERFTVVAGGCSVRDRPVVFVTDAPRGLPRPALALGAPRPNPAPLGEVRAVVTLGAAVPRLVARVIDARGRLVRLLRDGPAAAGDLRLAWDASSAGAGPGPGLYFLQVQGAGISLTRKIVLLGR